ncbi:MAG TPA: preprotein translocase subunit YajC [Gemmatimonadales bacterium]|nr:preprotein translocase subunit YajC [Gemmatimonadales bacterium]
MTTHPLFALLFAPAGQDAGGGLLIFLVQIGLFIAIFYYLLIRPQRRQQEQHRRLLASLQRGDQIVTSGGVVGEVIHIKDDHVTIRSGESRLVILRSGIANITNRTAPAAEAKGEAKAEAKAK